VKTIRDSAKVHVECKSVLGHLMENRKERNINNAKIMAWKDEKQRLHFEVLDTGSWRSQESRLFMKGVPKF